MAGAVATLTLGPAWLPGEARAQAADVTYFRIANGSTAGTYYPIGGIIASAISNPPGGAPCAEGGACGVPGLLATAVASAGSVANVEAVGSGRAESGFAQADVAYWAQTATGDFAGLPAIADLRAIAKLYPEALHIVARSDAPIRSLSDLRGMRVSLDEPGSGTLVDARLVLDAAGIADDEMTVLHLPAAGAAQAMQAGELDAFFFVGGYPAPAISQLAGQSPVRLIALDDAVMDRLTKERSFFTRDSLPAGTYRGNPDDVATLSVGALWITRADQPEELIHAITRVLWNDNTLRQLGYGHPIGRRIRPENAVTGIPIPLHPGAERYYREAGLLR